MINKETPIMLSAMDRLCIIREDSDRSVLMHLQRAINIFIILVQMPTNHVKIASDSIAQLFLVTSESRAKIVPLWRKRSCFHPFFEPLVGGSELLAPFTIPPPLAPSSFQFFCHWLPFTICPAPFSFFSVLPAPF